MKIEEIRKKKGISLIVLIITIAIIIILASAVIISIANNRPIESAKEATASHNNAVLKENAAVLSAQWEVDRLLDSSIGTRTEYVMHGLETQGFTEEEMENIFIDEETGKINNMDEFKQDIVNNTSKYLEMAKTTGQNITSNKDIGIGTDGKVVNLDLWHYVLKDNGIELGEDYNSSNYYPSYKGKIINGKIEGTIPQVIYMSDNKKCYNVVSLFRTFTGRSSSWGYTGESSSTEPKGDYGTFSSRIVEAPKIPNTVTDMYETFCGCPKLTTIPKLPNGIINMEGTFRECTALLVAPEIPSSVTNMSWTFSDCTNLTTAPVIPNSVTDMTSTFEYCKKLSGDLVINANPKEFNYCLTDVTSSGHLYLTR